MGNILDNSLILGLALRGGAMSVRIAYMPGALPSGQQGLKFFRQLVALGDEYGYDSIWLSDRVVSQQHSLEPLIALAMVAAYSEKLKFGTSVLQLPLRNPVVLAKEMATLDFLSGGRFLPAVGLGQDDPREYEACGVRKEDRGQRADEALALIRRLWCEGKVTHHGRFYSTNDVTITPRPVQEPCLPIWIGGRSKAAQRRVGRLGDGWLVSAASPQEVNDGTEVVFSTAAEHGRQIEEDHIGVLVGFFIASNMEEAAAVAEPYIIRQRPELPFTQYSALGTPEQVRCTIENYLKMGASKFVVRPLCSPERAIQQLERFGSEVLPYFHR